MALLSPLFSSGPNVPAPLLLHNQTNKAQEKGFLILTELTVNTNVY